ncbi:ribose-5-phosphate isomerase RpiA [Leadbettera azotonutricia]|uniref:Ribose-5-phosphate isomerase A n=1 Tax=Leadbettera azotonutricia (strain ATCC BAA-888 / DSM 13862 / ZAS-9) TaxID=545695 RepID=F5Y9W0_LEAAZ|nr:ribose-5-phosphate isomerase RpiA [Leadbettera azotonutricia]AEF81711.1 ribose 5-phosphate isomerase A [Leadbettera azotonutricia ZAS-9]
MDQKEIKEMVGKAAVEALVRSGMKLGLGTGSTAIPAVRHIGSLMQQGKLKNILAVPTSFQTSIECEKWGIPLYTLNSKDIGGELDLTIDGADEVDPQNYCVKGGGGALLVEKIVAYASRAYCIVVDEGKLVNNLGLKFPVPIEVIAEARIPVTRSLEKLGAEATLREALRKAGPVITEHGHLLLDILFKDPVDPKKLEAELNRIPGVVENGFFTGPSGRELRPQVFVGRSDGKLEIRK